MPGGKTFTVVGALAAACLGGSVALADTTAFSPVVNSGTQQFDTMFGIDFNTNASSIQVTQLGVFDNGADGVLNTDSNTQPIVVQIWNRDTGTALATVNFGANDGNGNPYGTGTDTTVGSGKVFFKPLGTPLILPGLGHYYISEDYSQSEEFENSNGNASFAPTVSDGGGLITAVGLGRASNIHGVFYNGSDGTLADTTLAPSAVSTSNGFIDGGPPARYAGPNFIFSAVPEPASLGLFGIAGVGLLARRRVAPAK